MKTIETPAGTHTIIKQEGSYTLLAKYYQDGTFHEYVVCSDYNEEKGTWWHGHYFWHDLDGALEYFKMKTKPNYIRKERLEELATIALHALVEEGEYKYYDDDLALTESELEYFGIETEDNNNYEFMIGEMSYVFNEDESEIEMKFRDLGILL
jgi:hypothetical protein